jgi:hypothetical protein
MADETEKKEEELNDVIAEDRNRGTRRKRLDFEERRKQTKLRNEILRAFAEGSEGGLINALLDAGWDENSPEFAHALAVFRETVRKRH